MKIEYMIFILEIKLIIIFIFQQHPSVFFVYLLLGYILTCSDGVTDTVFVLYSITYLAMQSNISNTFFPALALVSKKGTP